MISFQEHLKSIIKSNNGKVNLDIDMMSLIEQRLAVLDKFIAANISSAFSQEAQKGLNDLMRDKKKFLDSTKLYFSLSHSKFIKSLHQYFRIVFVNLDIRMNLHLSFFCKNCCSTLLNDIGYSICLGCTVTHPHFI